MGVPGFFATLRGALSDLPRHDPVYNELAVISKYNRQARRLKAAISDARSDVVKMVEQVTEGGLKGNFTADDLRHWRLLSFRALSGTAIVYDTWMRSLVLEGVDFIVRIIVGACQYAADSREARRVQETIEEWARNQGIIAASYPVPENAYEYAEMPNFVRIVGDFGVIYKKRRLNFVLYEINNLYQHISEDADACAADPESLDLLKIKIQKCIDELSVFEDMHFLSRQTAVICRRLFLGRFANEKTNMIAGDTHFLGKECVDEISKLIERLSQECDLIRDVDRADAVLASPLLLNLGERCRTAILTGYLGYFFWDIVLRPTASALSLDAGPIEEILIDRISPEDANSIILDDRKNVLLGSSFAGFGGFFSRSIRENDYLWGRLHAVDRLFDILIATVPMNIRDDFDIDALKKRAFESVLDEEAKRLKFIPGLIAEVMEKVRVASG
jgi:patatin-related protein